MERSENHDTDHIIDIARRSDTSSPGPDRRHDEERASSSSALPFSQSFLASSNGANTRNYSFTRRSDGYDRRSRSPFDSGVWISIELVVTLSQIIASIVVLSLWRWRHENPRASLFAWVIGYAFGCVATLPLLYWRFLHRNQGTEQDSTQTRQDASQNNHSEPSPFAAISLLRSTDEEDRQTAVSSARSTQSVRTSARVNVLVVYRFKMALHYFLVTWITFGNGWTFGLGWHSPSADAPNFYRFCILFLKICCIGFSSLYAAYVAICCCLLGFQYYLNHTRGAATKTINALPTYKFKLKDRNGDNRDTSSGVGGSGGTLEAGTKKERIISGEDAACCICLEKYADNEELRKLPCGHFFHVDCVDKWLKKNGSCPLCKCGIGKTVGHLQ